MRQPEFGSNKTTVPEQQIVDKQKASLISSILSKNKNKVVDPNIDPISGRPLLGATPTPATASGLETATPMQSSHAHIPALPVQPVKIPFKEMLAIHKEAAHHPDEPRLKERSIYTTLDKSLIVAALTVMVFGTYIIYNQLPTHPLLVLGIVAVCISSGIVTSIARW